MIGNLSSCFQVDFFIECLSRLPRGRPQTLSRLDDVDFAFADDQARCWRALHQPRFLPPQDVIVVALF